MSDVNPIIGKIEALLNKTAENGCTEAETAAAAAAAARLLLKHNLTMHDVLNARDEAEQTTHESCPMNQHGPGAWKWQQRIAAGCARVTGCSMCYDKPRNSYDFDHSARRWKQSTVDGVFYFTGTPSNIRVAIRLYRWILDQLDRCEEIARGVMRARYGLIGRGWRQSFFTGAALRCNRRLIDEFDRQVAELGARNCMLALYDANEAYEKAQFGSLKIEDVKQCASNAEAYKRGQLAADKLDLAAGMDTRPALQARSV